MNQDIFVSCEKGRYSNAARGFTENRPCCAMAAVAATQTRHKLPRRVAFDRYGMTPDHSPGPVLEDCWIAPQSGKSIVAEAAGNDAGSRTRRAIRVRGHLRSIGIFTGEGDDKMLVRFGARTEITRRRPPPGTARQRIGRHRRPEPASSSSHRRRMPVIPETASVVVFP